MAEIGGAEPEAGNIHNQNKNNNDDNNKDDDKDDVNHGLEGIYVVYAYMVSRYRRDKMDKEHVSQLPDTCFLICTNVYRR